MSPFKWLASVTLATTVLPVLAAEPHCPGDVESLRFRLVGRSRIIVPVKINHTGPYDFLVDTGAQVTAVDSALAAEFHLTMEGTTGIVGVGFHTQSSFGHLEILEAGSHAIANPMVVVYNLGFLQVADRRIRGILGGNFLQHFDVLIDYDHGILCLDNAKVMQLEVKGKHTALVTPSHSEGGALSTEPLIISVSLSGVPARSLLLLLDSGISTPFLYEVGKNIAGGFSASAPICDRGPDGIERVFSIVPPQEMEIGKLAFHRISFVTPAITKKAIPKVEVDGLLPTVFFRRLYISYADRFVVLEPW
jgi:hypothetical protein